MRSNQQGFSVAETGLVILIIVLIIFGGWWVWHKHRGASSTGTAATFTSAASVHFLGGQLNKANLSNATTTLDVANCPVGKDSLDFGQGKADFLISGKSGTTCNFSYGTAPESSSAPTSLSLSCKVPTTFTTSLGVNSTFGVDLTPIKAYCVSA